MLRMKTSLLATLTIKIRELIKSFSTRKMREVFSRSTKTPWSDAAWYIFTIFVFVALVSSAGYALIQQQKRFLLGGKYKEISTIADLKTSQLVQWRKERFAEGASIRANAMMADRINDYIAGKDKEIIRRELKLWMANLVDLGDYKKVILFNTDGTVLVSDSEFKTPPIQHYLDHVSDAVKEHELLLSDFHRDYHDAPFDLDLTIPIMRFDGVNSRCIAVLVLDIDPNERLYPLIQSWPAASSSAETLLINQNENNALVLNKLRHRNTSGTLKLPLLRYSIPAMQAAIGHEGSFEGTDYRNENVLCAARVIPGTKWWMVAKIDKNEVMAPISKSILYVVLTGGFVVIAMVLGVFLWGLRRRAETLRRIIEIQKISESQLQGIHAQLEHQIMERTSDLTDINSLLRLEMIEREQLERKLLSAKRLEAIGQIAGGVAHEVRNPLNAILTITEALFREKEIESNPEYEPFIHHIRTQVNRLVQLMNDLLDLGRTIPATNLQPMPLYGVCRDSLNLWKSTGLSKNKSATLTSDNDDISALVLADGLKLQQVFFNLLENAGHHTTDRSIIKVQLTHRELDLPNKMAVVQVIDQGTGIAEDKLSKVFDPFYTNRQGGTGLGLALVRHFIENMGGTVQIWNNDPPPGCTVEVCIPLYREESK